MKVANGFYPFTIFTQKNPLLLLSKYSKHNPELLLLILNNFSLLGKTPKQNQKCHYNIAIISSKPMFHIIAVFTVLHSIF